MSAVTCPGLKSEPMFTSQLTGEGVPVPTIDKLRGATLVRMRDLGLPGSEYACVLRVQELDFSRRIGFEAAFRLQVDTGGYGPQWEVIVAVCGCERASHVAYTEPVRSLEVLENPTQRGAD